MRPLLKVALANIILYSAPCFADVSASVENSKEISLLPAGLLQISEIDAFSKYAFVVDKSERKLYVYERNGPFIKKIDEQPADIGKSNGNKTARDDKKTPEGIYFLEQKLAPPAIPFDLYGTLAFTTNYPNLFDRRENKTGSGIWLHSIPDTVPLNRGSRGCVVVRNNVIQKLDNYVKLKETPILIFDKIDYVNSSEHNRRRQEVNSFIESWRSAWEKSEISKYMDFYDSSFKSPGFNYTTWKKHKESLVKKYNYIKVKLSQSYILTHNNQIIVKTLQKYESDRHVDYGIKVLYVVKLNDSYKIIREEWETAPQEAVTASIVSSTEVSKNISQSKNQ